MTVTNTNKKGIDLPFFEVMNYAPVASSAVAALCTAEDGSDPFIYYLSTSAFYRYDTHADSWQLLGTPNVAPASLLSMRYTKNRGYHGRIISATTSTVTIAGLRSNVLDDSVLRIEQGTGSGQKRTLSFQSETVHDAGVVTAVSQVALADSTKKWKFNQWAGYMVGITYGTNPTQYKKIIYNDTNTLYISDSNLMPQDPWNAPAAYAAIAPYALPSSTAGSQSHYQIMSTTFTLDSNWDVTPDRTSFFTTETGGIYLLSSTTSAPFMTLQYYDVIHDSWVTKTVPQSLLTAALGTDATIERVGKLGSALTTNVGAVNATSRTLTDAGQSLARDRYANYRIQITGGTGIGQNRRIVAHTPTTFTVSRPWSVTPDSTSTYEIWPDWDRLWFAGNGSASILAYSPENDWWMQGQFFDDGVTNNIAASYGSYSPFGVSIGARIAAGVRAVNGVPTAGGTNYVIGDILTCSVGGTGAQVIVTSIAPGGVVTGIELVNSGTATGFTVGTGRATAGGTGSGCTIEITSVGATANITTATNHFLRTGDSVTFSGCSEGAWNTSHTILGVYAVNGFSVATTATANMAATASQSTTTIVDPTKNWTVNEHVGRLVHLCVAGTAPTSQIRWITANTANTLTVTTITAAVNGTSKYAIYDSKAFGIDNQRKEADKLSYGWATGGSTTTLSDSSKSWIPNQWAGYLFKIEAGTGYGSGRISITSNTETTLTFATQSFTPDSTTKYEIADSWGIATAGTTTTLTESTTKNWVVNQWAGKRVRITGGAATAPGTEVSISSNTSTALTFSTITAPDTTGTYAILGAAARGAGIDLISAWGTSDASVRGKYMYLPRGGNLNGIDIYDITTGRWIYGSMFSPQALLFTTGSNYAYDGVDTIYATQTSSASVPLRVFAINVLTGKVRAFAQATQLGSTVHIGNFMEIVTTPDGVSFMYHLHNTSTLMSRAMIF
jgi:hypothetical protein